QCRLVVEIKQPKDGTHHRGIEQRLVDTLNKNDLKTSAIVISFYEDSLRLVHEIDPEITTGYLFAKPVLSLSHLKRDLGIQYVGPHFLLATADFINQAHS